MSEKIERVKTGVPGLDDILHGGIPRRNIVLISGGPGTAGLLPTLKGEGFF